MNFAHDVTYPNYNPMAPVMQPLGGKFLCLKLIRTASSNQLAFLGLFGPFIDATSNSALIGLIDMANLV
jgi:hypothetical protein